MSWFRAGVGRLYLKGQRVKSLGFPGHIGFCHIFFLNNTLKLEKAFSDHGSYKNKPGSSDLACRLQCPEPWFRAQTLEPDCWAQIQSPTSYKH